MISKRRNEAFVDLPKISSTIHELHDEHQQIDRDKLLLPNFLGNI